MLDAALSQFAPNLRIFAFQDGKNLIEAGSPRAGDVGDVLDSLDRKWAQLEALNAQKSHNLDLANRQQNLNREVAALKKRMGRAKEEAESSDVGQNLTDVNSLIRRNEVKRKNFRNFPIFNFH